MRRGKAGDGACPVTSTLQLIGDKWTLLIVRELAANAKRTRELLAAMQPISSRTLMMRLRDMETDEIIARRTFPGSAPHVEYVLTARGEKLLPLLDAIYLVATSLACGSCEARRQACGDYCKTCPQQSALNPVDKSALSLPSSPPPAAVVRGDDKDFNVLW